MWISPEALMHQAKEAQKLRERAEKLKETEANRETRKSTAEDVPQDAG